MCDDMGDGWSEADTDDGLGEALIDADAKRAAALLRERSSLSKTEIDMLADLLDGHPGDEPFYRRRLVFQNWRPGRPVNPPAEALAKSQARGRQVRRLIDEGYKRTAAYELVREQTGVAVSQLKRDLSNYERAFHKSG